MWDGRRHRPIVDQVDRTRFGPPDERPWTRVHLCPEPRRRCPCCRLWPSQLHYSDRLTDDPARVTCRGPGRACFAAVTMIEPEPHPDCECERCCPACQVNGCGDRDVTARRWSVYLPLSGSCTVRMLLCDAHGQGFELG